MAVIKSQAAEFLADLVEYSACVLERNAGLSADQARIVAKTLGEKMRLRWGGQQIYFPKQPDLSDRDLAMWERFNGTNVNDLAREFGCSVQWVYKRLNVVRAILATEIS